MKSNIGLKQEEFDKTRQKLNKLSENNEIESFKRGGYNRTQKSRNEMNKGGRYADYLS